MAYRLVLTADVERARAPARDRIPGDDRVPTRNRAPARGGEVLQHNLSVPSEGLEHAVQQQHKLEVKLQQALSWLAADASTVAVRTALQEAQVHAQQVRQCLVEPSWNSIPVVLKTSTSTIVKAMEVFETPELMEAILYHLPVDDIFAAQQVCRCMRDTVNGSKALQKLNGLLPYDAAEIFSPLTRNLALENDHARFPSMYITRSDSLEMSESTAFSGISFVDHGGYWITPSIRSPSPEDMVNAMVGFALHWDISAGSGNTKLGSRSRSLTPCQPPVREMTCRLQFDPYADEPDLRKPFDISLAPGQYLTIGDLYNFVQRIRSQYPTGKTPKGSTISSVKFQAEMKVNKSWGLTDKRRAAAEMYAKREYGR